MIGLITLDPAYKDGKYTENPLEGIKRSGMIYFPWLFSDEYLAKHIEIFRSFCWASNAVG